MGHAHGSATRYRPQTAPILPSDCHVCSQLTEGGYVLKQDIFTFYEKRQWSLLMGNRGG